MKLALRSMVTKSNKEKTMAKAKSSGGAQSTNDSGFRKGSKKGIPASTMMVSPAKTKGNTAKFAGGKKKVGK